MEQKAKGDPAAQEPTFLESTISKMDMYHRDVVAIGELITRATSRLDELCNRVNTTDYSKNHEKSVSGAGIFPKDGGQVQVPIPQGLVGRAMSSDEAIQTAVKYFHGEILPSLSIAISYLEKHI